MSLLGAIPMAVAIWAGVVLIKLGAEGLPATQLDLITGIAIIALVILKLM